MHIAEPAPKGSMGTSNTAPIAGAGPSKQPPPPSNHPSRPTPAALKDGKPAGVKREGSSGAATGSGTPSTSNQQEGPRTPDAKTLRRLAQNREAARKSRLRKKAYIQNLETSRIRLSQLEQELHRSRNQGAVFGGGALSGSNGGLSPEAAWFDMEHARWQEEHGKMMRHLRAALEAADQQHPERCFLWIGGFRPSELIKVAARHAEPLTEPQAMGVCGVQQWAREAEAALDHELQAMHRSVSEAVSSDAAALLCPYSDVPGYMATMSLAIAKLASLEAFVRQADALRLQALHRLPQILTARQAARCFLAIADYSHRLRALSELWHTRPRHEPVATIPAAGPSHGQPFQSSRAGGLL